jgi:membrane protease YdiL (CAAX protease family)
VKFVDKTNIISLGFKWKGYERDAGTGFFSAVFLLGLGTIILITTGYLTYTGISFQPKSLLLSLVLFAMVAFFEEIVFRGYLLNNLMASMPPWIALCVSSIIFGLVHMSNPGAGFLPIFNIFAGGFLLGINYIYTRNLFFSILLHFAWNFFQGPIFGYSVSGFELGGLFTQSMNGPAWITGGEFGFEGSILQSILSIGAVAFFATLYNKKIARTNVTT